MRITFLREQARREVLQISAVPAHYVPIACLASPGYTHQVTMITQGYSLVHTTGSRPRFLGAVCLAQMRELSCLRANNNSKPPLSCVSACPTPAAQSES